MGPAQRFMTGIQHYNKIATNLYFIPQTTTICMQRSQEKSRKVKPGLDWNVASKLAKFSAYGKQTKMLYIVHSDLQ